MGICTSSTANSSEPAANLVMMDGSLRQFSECVRSEKILDEYPGHIICNWDGLHRGRNISHVLKGHDQLHGGQLYFLLPKRKLEFVVTESDMAALVSTANSAIKQQKKAGESWDKFQSVFDLHPHAHDEGLPTIKSGESWEKESCGVNFSVSRSHRRKLGKNRRRSTLETIMENV